VPGDEIVMGISPDGRYVVTHDNTTGFLTTLAVDLDATNGTPDGTLTVSGAAVSTGFTNVHGLSFDAQGKWLLVVTRDGDLEVRSFSSSGVVGGTAVDTGTVSPASTSSRRTSPCSERAVTAGGATCRLLRP
jgi:hypothetical protein